MRGVAAGVTGVVAGTAEVAILAEADISEGDILAAVVSAVAASVADSAGARLVDFAADMGVDSAEWLAVRRD